MRRVFVVTVAMVIPLLVTAPAALAHDGGEGYYGQTNDKVTTLAGFCIIGFFVAFVFFASLLQGRLEKRKHARLDAAQARARSPEWNRGW